MLLKGERPILYDSGPVLVCARHFVMNVVATLRHMDVGFMALVATGVFLAIFGTYFQIPYLGAKGLVEEG